VAGAVVAGGSASNAAAASSTTPEASVAALQAKFNARERERTEAETKARHERAAEAAVLEQAKAEHRKSLETPGLAEGDIGGMGVDAVMALQDGGQAAGA